MKSLLVLLFATLASMNALASSTAGNGTDDVTWQNDGAWFLGTKAFTYCFVRSENFGVPTSDLKSALELAFEKWDSYVERKVVFSSGSPISTRAEFKNACSSDVDLVFYFGGMSSEIEMAKDGYDRPIAFAHRSSYDFERNWGKGFIWLADPGTVMIETSPFRPAYNGPVWTPHNLAAVLLHEIGHVYGNSHLHGTIMRPNLGFYLREQEEIDDSVVGILSNIEHERELVTCLNCAHEWVHETFCPSTNVYSRPFVDWLEGGGLLAKDPISMRFVKPQSLFRFETGTLYVETEKGRYELAIDIKARLALSEDPTPLFRRSSKNGLSELNSQSSQYYGLMRSPDGREREVFINWNQPTILTDYKYCAGRGFFIGFMHDNLDYPQYFFGAKAQ